MEEIVINVSATGIRQQPAVAPFGSSHFLIAWTDLRDFTIKGRLVETDGTLSSDEFTVSADDGSNTSRQSPTAAATPSGPVVAWTEKAINPPGPRPHVKLQRFDTSGQKVGAEIQVSTDDVDPDQRPAVTGMIDGGFVVVWIDARPDQRVRAQRFSVDGVKKGPELAVNTTEGFHRVPGATRLADGNYVVSWMSDPSAPGGGVLVFRMFDLEGTPVSDEVTPNLSGFRGEKALAPLDDGGFVIVHVRRTGQSVIGVDESIVEAHIMDASGAAIVPFTVSTGRNLHTSFPAVAALPNKRFLATWVQKKADTTATTPTVRARVFSSAVESGPEVVISRAADGDRVAACVATKFNPAGASPSCLAWVESTNTAGGALNLDVRGRLMSASTNGTLDG